jgi:hypothetical protein
MHLKLIVPLLSLSLAAPAFADDDAPPLTAAQEAKLARLRALFQPGGKVNSMASGVEQSEAACGARIPLEVDPSTVALEPMNGDRSDIDTTCNEFASAVVYTCGTNAADSDPVVKEMMRTNVKRMVCRATKDRALTDRGAGMTNYGVKFTLENGTLTLLYVIKGASMMRELGERFLAEHVRNEQGLSIGGQRLKRKTLEQLKRSDLLADIKKKCGLELDVQVDDALFEHFSLHPTRAALGVCYSGLQVLYNNCSSDGVHNLEITAPEVKAAILAHVKTISCVLSEQVSASVKPNDVLEIGGDFEGKHAGPSMSVEAFLFSWLKAHAGDLAGKPAPATAKKPRR